MKKPEPAVFVWAGIVGAALIADVLLVARGHRSLSQVADCRIGRAMRRYLNGHLDSELILDAFALAAYGIRRTRVPAPPALGGVVAGRGQLP